MALPIYFCFFFFFTFFQECSLLKSFIYDNSCGRTAVMAFVLLPHSSLLLGFLLFSEAYVCLSHPRSLKGARQTIPATPSLTSVNTESWPLSCFSPLLAFIIVWWPIGVAGEAVTNGSAAIKGIRSGALRAPQRRCHTSFTPQPAHAFQSANLCVFI